MKAESDTQINPRNELGCSAMLHLPFTMLNALELYFSWFGKEQLKETYLRTGQRRRHPVAVRLLLRPSTVWL